MYENNTCTLKYNNRVSKRIAPSGTGEDLDLNNNLFVVYARRVTASTQRNSLESHVGGGTAVRGASPTQLAIATTAPAGNTVAPVRAPEDYRLQTLSPTGCSRASCDLFIGIDTNTGDNGFLDIYMEGTAAGWVAVGFSETPNMVCIHNIIAHYYNIHLYLCSSQFSADVVSCNRQGDTIVAIDGWNQASPARASNRDTIQDVTLFSSSFDANTTRLSCT